MGVERYADPQMPALAGPGNDVELMARTLREGFAFDHVVVLRDAQATRQQILRALDDLQSTGASSIVFYFSGHGSQVVDTSGDEPDGWDETLVPFDSRRDTRPNRDILDDELNARLDALAQTGAAVTFIFDSCHSGTATRSLDGVRAAPPGEEIQQSNQEIRPLQHTAIAAARAGERAYERNRSGRVYGLLTWSLVQAMRANPQATWRELMAQVQPAVTAAKAVQHPQLEGAGQDRVLFGQTTRTAQAHITVHQSAPGRLRIDAGLAHGLGIGAQIELIAPAGAVLGAAPVIEAQPHAAIVAFASPIPAGTRARILTRALTVPPLLVHGSSPAVLQRARTLASVRSVRERDRAQVRVDGQTLIEPNGAQWHIPDAEALAGRLAYWAAWHAAHSLKHADPQLPVDFEVRPRRSVKHGETVSLRVHNHSNRRLYLNVLSIAADGEVAVVYPPAGASEQIEPFEAWPHPIQAFLPPGMGHRRVRLTLILTTEPADFQFLSQGRTATADLPKARWTTRSVDFEISR